MTFAFGGARYCRMAATLGRSLALHAPGVLRALVTDDPRGAHASWYDIVRPLQTDWGTNLDQRLHLDRYTPFDRTLFIDSDIIAVGNLEEAFAQFEGYVFSPVGQNVLRRGAEDPFMDVAHVLDHFGLDSVPKFNGGLFYLDSEAAGPFMKTARALSRNYRRLGFSDFRMDGPNDEALFATAMALHDLPMLDDGGSIMATPSGLGGRLRVDALEGRAQFEKYGTSISPTLVHFAGAWAAHPVYRQEQRKLARWADGWSHSRIERHSRLLYPWDVAAGTVRMHLRRAYLGSQRRIGDVLERVRE